MQITRTDQHSITTRVSGYLASLRSFGRYCCLLSHFTALVLHLTTCSAQLSLRPKAGAIVALQPGGFGCEPISPDDAKAFRRSISEGRRPPLKRVQTALCSFVKHYGCAWTRYVYATAGEAELPVSVAGMPESCCAA